MYRGPKAIEAETYLPNDTEHETEDKLKVTQGKRDTMTARREKNMHEVKRGSRLENEREE